MVESAPSTIKHRILVVDDDNAIIRQIEAMLADGDYIVETARDGVEAIERVRADPPDLMLLDVMMPKMNGLEVCRIVKSLSSESFVPIILLTVKSDIESKVTGLKLGADDYLAKPFNPLELLARVDSMLRIKALQDKINSKRKDLEKLSLTDDLTGLYNHRAMQKRLRDEFRRAQRYNEPLSIIMIDADHFKKVNDRHGHQFGDFVLNELAQIIQRCVREIDIVARYGGEEFLVILPQTHFSGSLMVADRIWRTIGANTFTRGDNTHRLTASMGISFFPNKNINTVEQLVSFADSALYQAKREGRDRICLHQHLNYMYRPDGVDARLR